MNVKDTDNKGMKTLLAVNRILKIYDDSMDNESVDLKKLNAKALKISENRFIRILIMLSEGGFIDNVEITENIDGTVDVDYSESAITLEGVKYYADNSLFLKAAGAIPETVSGIARGVLI